MHHCQTGLARPWKLIDSVSAVNLMRIRLKLIVENDCLVQISTIQLNVLFEEVVLLESCFEFFKRENSFLEANVLRYSVEQTH